MKIVVTDNDHANLDIEARIIHQAGLEYRLEQCKTEEDLIAHCQDAEVFMNQYAPITRKVMEALPNLKMVVRYGVGVNNIEVDAATELGIQICNVPDYGMQEVSDHALAMMLAMTRKIVAMNDYTKTTTWDYIQSIPIKRHSEMTVGVIGLGRIGRAFAGKVHALGCRILGYDPFYQPNAADQTEYIILASVDEMIEQSDVISIHCPVEHARNLFDARAFQKMKNTAYLINVSRGGIIKESDLIEALNSGEIAGAALDCLETEPTLPGSALFACKNLMVTPHMGWYSEEAAAELNQKVAEEAVRFVTGQKVHYPVNQPKPVR